MTIDLKPSQEQFIREAMQAGRYENVNDLLGEFLSAWKKNEVSTFDLQKAQAASANIRELRKGINLGDSKMKDLIAKGRR